MTANVDSIRSVNSEESDTGERSDCENISSPESRRECVCCARLLPRATRSAPRFQPGLSVSLGPDPGNLARLGATACEDKGAGAAQPLGQILCGWQPVVQHGHMYGPRTQVCMSRAEFRNLRCPCCIMTYAVMCVTTCGCRVSYHRAVVSHKLGGKRKRSGSLFKAFLGGFVLLKMHTGFCVFLHNSRKLFRTSIWAAFSSR